MEFPSVEDAQRVFDSRNVELDGRILYIDFASNPKFEENPEIGMSTNSINRALLF